MPRAAPVPRAKSSAKKPAASALSVSSANPLPRTIIMPPPKSATDIPMMMPRTAADVDTNLTPSQKSRSGVFQSNREERWRSSDTS